MFEEIFSSIFKAIVVLFFLSMAYEQLSRGRKTNKRTRKKSKSPIKVNYRNYVKSNHQYCVYTIRSGRKIYYGVTSNFEARRAAHLLNMQNESHDNYLLQRAFDANHINEKSFRIHNDNLSRSAAYKMERALRPRPNMGWNLAAGGE